MNELLDQAPYGPRDDDRFLQEMEELTRHHLEGCKEYARIWSHWKGGNAEDLPFLHVGLFKKMLFRTEGQSHERTLTSSSTSGSQPSQILLDKQSSRLQARSALAILSSVVGEAKRPLLVLDDGRSLRDRGAVSARMAAAMSLSPIATTMRFMLSDSNQTNSMKWDELRAILDSSDELLVYGFTSILWLAWGIAEIPDDIRLQLRNKRIVFVHSGGWKKLEALRVDRRTFDETLVSDLAPGSHVVDYYGLVEQVGVIYPLCISGYRHVPLWADVIVRDPYTLEPLFDAPGQLQFMNTLAHGAPYHSVLSEDMGILVSGACDCGRVGKRFELLGRMPKAELRGCANV